MSKKNRKRETLEDLYDLTPEEQLRRRKAFDNAIDTRTGKIVEQLLYEAENSLIDSDLNDLISQRLNGSNETVLEEVPDLIDGDIVIKLEDTLRDSLDENGAAYKKDPIVIDSLSSIINNEWTQPRRAPDWFEEEMKTIITNSVLLARKYGSSITREEVSSNMYSMLIDNTSTLEDLCIGPEDSDLVNDAFRKYLSEIFTPENDKAIEKEKPRTYRSITVKRHKSFSNIIDISDGMRTISIDINNLIACDGDNNTDYEFMENLQEDVIANLITNMAPTAIMPINMYNEQFGNILSSIDTNRFRFYSRTGSNGEVLVLCYIFDDIDRDEIDDILEELCSDNMLIPFCKSLNDASANKFSSYNTSFEKLTEDMGKNINDIDEFVNAVYDDGSTLFDSSKTPIGADIIIPIEDFVNCRKLERFNVYIKQDIPTINSSDTNSDDFFAEGEDFESQSDSDTKSENEYYKFNPVTNIEALNKSE